MKHTKLMTFIVILIIIAATVLDILGYVVCRSTVLNISDVLRGGVTLGCSIVTVIVAYIVLRYFDLIRLNQM